MHNNVTSHVSLPDKIQILCVLYISIWAISPPLAYGHLYRLFAVLAAAIWLYIELLNRPGTFLRPSFATLCATVFISYTALFGYWIEGTQDIIRNIQIYICLLFLIFHESYSKRNIRQLRIVFWAALFIYPLWLAITLNAYTSVHNVSRLLTRSTGIESEYMEQGIGGFALVYSILLGIPAMLCLAKNILKSKASGFNSHKFPFLFALILLNLVLGCAVIVKSGYSIANILLIGSVGIAILVGSIKSLFSWRFFSFLLVSLFFFTILIEPAVNFVEEAARGTMYERKIDDLRYSINLNESVGTVSDRTERYSRSIDYFLENPIFGTLHFDKTGKHSAILDKFARYGLFVGLCFAFAILYLPFRYIKQCLGAGFGMSVAVAFVATGFSFLNNIFSSFGFMLFIFYPVALTYVEDMTSKSLQTPGCAG